MAVALISLGANTPDKSERIARCIETIGNMAHITALTPIYETPAEGSIAAAPYANALVEIETNAQYEELRTTFNGNSKPDAPPRANCKASYPSM